MVGFNELLVNLWLQQQPSLLMRVSFEQLFWNRDFLWSPVMRGLVSTNVCGCGYLCRRMMAPGGI